VCSSIGKGTVFLGTHIIMRGKKISFSERCTVNNFVFINSRFEEVRIGSNVTLSDWVYITTLGLDPDKLKNSEKVHIESSVIIEDGAWLGARSVILPGVRVGKGSIVAAGSVVTENVPPHVLVAGVPATLKRALSSS
jgi:acetyltransferase-like isoleucine patch superfamily enzyme